MTRKHLLLIPMVLLIFLIGGFFFVNYRVQSLVDARIAEFIASGQYQALDYESVELTPKGDILMKKLHVIDEAGNEYILDNIRITDFDYFNATPRHLLLTAQGMHFPSGIPAFGDSANPPWRAYLNNFMEEDYLPLELSYQYTYQPDDAARLDTNISISLPDSFHLSSVSTIHNLSLENMNNYANSLSVTPVPYSTLLNNADIPSASLAFRDMGIVKDMLAVQGQNYGMNGDEYRQQLLAQLQTMVLFTPTQLQGMAQDYLARFAEFLQGEKTLQISIQPEYGGNLQKLQGEIQGAFFIGNFSGIVDLLNLKIETLP